MITQELIAYVKSELNKGRTREEIRASLLQGGGWTEGDMSEVFRTVMPLETPASGKIVAPLAASPVLSARPLERPHVSAEPTPVFSLNSLINTKDKAPSSAAPPEPKHNLHKIPLVPAVLALLLGALCFVLFYFYSPELSMLHSKTLAYFSSLMQKKVPVVPVVDETPQAPAPIEKPVNCGTTLSPDRKKPTLYTKDPVLKCLGERASACKSAEGTIEDQLFPTFFRVVAKDSSCRFELSYKADSTLVDVYGKKLAGRTISCPLSIVKSIDETDPNNLSFKAPHTEDYPRHAVDIYFYGTLGVFIENNFDQKKIEALGCSGSFVQSVIQSYALMQSKN